MTRRRLHAHRLRLAVRCGVVLASAGLLLAGCGGSGASGGGSGGTLRIGDASSRIDSLNPFVGVNNFAELSWRIVYPYLVQYNANQQIVGDFAKSFSVSPDGKQITFTTYPGAKWSDGRPLTAADAAWTINTVVKFSNGATANLAFDVANVKSATAVGPTRLIVNYKTRTGTALNGLAQLPILPEHVWAPLATGSGKGLTTYQNTRLIGAGPFKLTSYTANQFVLFTRNPDFYGPEPKLSSVGVQFFTSNDALINALRTGQIDVAYEVPPTTVAMLRPNRSLAVNDVAGTDVPLLGFNNSSARHVHPELRNPTVRRAIDLAINKSQLVNVVADGSGTTTGSIIPPSVKGWHDPTLTAIPGNVAKANQLLDSLGFRRGPNGVRIAGGHPMSYTLLFPFVATGAPRVITEVVDDLSKIGIRINPRGSDYASYTSAVFAPNNKYLNWDFFISDYGANYDPEGYLSSWTCSEMGSNNDAGYCSKHYDSLVAKQAEQTGAARVATVRAAQDMLAHQRVVIPLYDANAISVSRDIGNLPTVTSTPFIVNYLSKLWLEQATL